MKQKKSQNQLLLGCVADDFTGASDMASFLAAGGLRTVLINGIPERELELAPQPQAIVIALKSRTAETRQAVSDAKAGFAWLKQHGAKQLYFKYCSTFDSTQDGNIGPVIDAVLEEYGYPYTIVCPALPVNGRTVFNGWLFVNNVPLHESPMKDHPLTPMRDSHVGRLLSAQGKYESYTLTYQSLDAGQDKIQEDLAQMLQNTPFYVVVDFFYESHAAAIVEAFGNLPFLTGGSGLATRLAAYHRQQEGLDAHDAEPVNSGTPGGGLILAGSCSVATQTQVSTFIERGGAALKIDPEKLLCGEQSQKDFVDFIVTHQNEDVLLYSSDSQENVKKNQNAGKEAISQLLENTMAYLAEEAEKHGKTRLIVAGGETAGAVTKALGYSAYLIGESIAPGVPVMIPVSHPHMRIVLKSGNFGQADFFERALRLTGKEQTPLYNTLP